MNIAQWVENNNQWFHAMNKDTKLMLSGDSDSLLSCLMLEKHSKGHINAFYSFKTLHMIEESGIDEHVAVDVDLLVGRAFGNHSTGWLNEDCINPNNLVFGENYYNKYAGSTFMLVLSLLDIDFSTWTDEMKMIALAIDAGFKGYYDDRFNKVWCKWIEFLGLDWAYDIVQEKSRDEMYEIINKYGLAENLKLKDNKLLSKTKLKPVMDMFGLTSDINNECNVWELMEVYSDVYTHNISTFNADSVFSCARVNATGYKLSLK